MRVCNHKDFFNEECDSWDCPIWWRDEYIDNHTRCEHVEIMLRSEYDSSTSTKTGDNNDE